MLDRCCRSPARNSSMCSSHTTTPSGPRKLEFYLLAIVGIVLLFRSARFSHRIIAGVVATMWIWTGIAYHGLFFAQINKAAYFFGALFLIEGAYIAYAGVLRDQLLFGFTSRPSAWLGVVFMTYAAVIYPLIAITTGHAYPEMPMFGVTPCPVTIFTFGLFLLTTRHLPRWLLVVPFFWSVIGGSAAILLDVPQDWVLLVSGLIAVPVLVLRDRNTPRETDVTSTAQ